ncbi:hypothetical protein OAG24_00645 [bacterium]|nr:hypothetical protein [bacterium]
MSDRQLDIIWTGPDWFTLPADVPGRLNGDDFVYFRWDCNLNPCDYTVVVESLDTAGPTYRSISILDKTVQLPLVHFGAHVRIGVIPNSEVLPSFEAELFRGSTYVIPNTHGQTGRFQMEQHGMQRLN